jgi:hypothetical protein
MRIKRYTESMLVEMIACSTSPNMALETDQNARFARVLAAQLNRCTPRKAWRFLPGASPGRVRANHPPVLSVASLKDVRKERT